MVDVGPDFALAAKSSQLADRALGVAGPMMVGESAQVLVPMDSN